MSNSNRIVEKYFSDSHFSDNVDAITKELVTLTDFKIEKELFRGFIYDEQKLGSVIYKGFFRDRQSVLKIQGLPPETDEIDIIHNFKSQNKSLVVRLPELYRYSHYDPAKGYGYLITEFIDGPHIFEMPYASSKEKEEFCIFYQEYRKNTLNTPFVKKDENNTIDFLIRRVDMWRRVALDRKNTFLRLDEAKIDNICARYKKCIKNHAKNINMVFCHGHLTANDIFKKGSDYILLSNLYWSYRPELYDLVFGVHWCIENIAKSGFSDSELEKFIAEWFHFFYNIPVVAEDPEGKHKLHFMLLERTMGGILLDTGAQPLTNENANRLFPMQVRLLENLIERIELKHYF